MDWDSPTTKRHIAEAEAQGCELLGQGRNASTRIYRLQCGHEKEVQPGNMQDGRFRCQICFNEKLKAEAAAYDCRLLTEGKSYLYRVYRLPCGHEKEVAVANMRKGSFSCKECVDQKLRREARTQGCELLGPGAKNGTRTYRLACGHEQVISTGSIRKGEVRCRTCLDARLIKEAEVQGCKLLGPGKNYQYRTYVLKCEHEREVRTAEMRSGNFRCQICLDDKLKQEAEAQGCELIGPGRNIAYRIYQLQCGHRQQVTLQGMRTGGFKCQTCLDNRLETEAKQKGCVLVGAGKNKDYRTYVLPCGHTQELRMDHVRKGNFRCQDCMEKKLAEEAEVQGCKLLGSGKSAFYRTYLLPCKHEQEVQTTHMRNGLLRCQKCLDIKLRSEAAARDCVLLGPGTKDGYRVYRLQCGHEREIEPAKMREGTFRCQTCEDYWVTLPSQVYLLHIKVGADEWLKLGYAKDVDFRTTRYGLPSEAEVSLLVTQPFQTGKEAQMFEQALHTKYRQKRLNVEEMLNFHTGSGATECYPVLMVETLLAEFKQAN